MRYVGVFAVVVMVVAFRANRSEARTATSQTNEAGMLRAYPLKAACGVAFHLVGLTLVPTVIGGKNFELFANAAGYMRGTV